MGFWLRRRSSTLLVLAILLVSCGAPKPTADQTQEAPAVYQTQEACEQANHCTCAFVMCDYVPQEKTFEEVCGKDFQKGWQCADS